MHKLGLFLATLALTVLPGTSCAADKTYAVQSIKDVVYYDGPDQHEIKHKLDLYLPKDLKDFPVLFFVHGGAWVTGDKNTFGLYALLGNAYAKKGIGVVVTNYRLTPEVKHPEHIKDVARAFAWCKKNIAKHGGNTDRIFACGHSAGAHLVSLLAGDETYLKAHDLTSKAIRGVIPISGPIGAPLNFMPDVFGTDMEVVRKASPIEHVRKDMPPFLILYADKDLPGCGGKQAQAFCKAIKAKDNKAEIIEVVRSGHVRIMISAGTEDDPVYDSILRFLRTNTDK